MRDYKNYKRGRVKKKNRSGKKWVFRLLKVVLFLSVIAGSTFFLKDYYERLFTSDYFSIREIIVTGEKRVSRKEVIEISGAGIGSNLMAVNIEDIAGRVETLSWVETANVRRILPGGLSIDIREREPVAILKAASPYYLDRSGTPFKKLDVQDSTDCPVIGGITVRDAEKDELAKEVLVKAMDFIETGAEEWPAELPVTEITVSKYGGISVISDGMEIKVGLGDYSVKLGRLKKVLDDLRVKERTAVFIDLTYSGQVVVK